MRSQAPARVVRQRKLNKSTLQQILREDQIESAEFHSLQNQYHVETGVERSEENEYHLQAALAASAGAGEKDTEKEIPAPPAQEGTNIDYDALYSLKFAQPATYIRFSQTVEECTGCQYDMTTEDDAFLKVYNQKKGMGARCSEADFEKIMEVFEETAELQAPFAAVDNTVVPFETMKYALKNQMDDKIQNAFAKDIYEHWKVRRQASGNKPLQPSLKFETHQENDDGDPYVCFRRREVRQTRKTRARDVQSTDKLKRLRKELEEGRQLVALAFQREMTKRELLNVDRNIFEQRAKVKEAKVRLGIKGDDEDLINQRPQKRKVSDFPALQRPSGSQVRLPGRSDGRPLDADLVQLGNVLAQKENLLQREIEEKTNQHRKWNQNHIDLTREPLSPVSGQNPDCGFRPATAQYQYLMTPPSSVASESSDHDSPLQEKPEPFTFRYNSPPEEDEPRPQPAYRRRIGRGGRLWIDRRGMASAFRTVEENGSDRWKYDQDDEEEQPVYEMDPYDTKALRFRATIPFPPHLLPQRPRQDDRNRITNGSPSNSRVAATGPPAAAPTAPT
ncbi:Enhancer of polycomb-like protein [Venustampulla echinocandica]|uniref:Enhancer of polycomb-like protein n=1 Tax=Venustampulla echinocandica TaxID=2656787 RepID=A0A370TID1_9HELO|nr:Enhancer of polycomb-like protein [Venustampulla echinocandica]RDL35118.1 Enhancer of polycomb-like protein [Venustampulla echinocandica]